MSRPKPRLWRKVFAYSFATILVVEVFTLSWYLFTYNRDLRVKELVRYLAALTRNVESIPDDDFRRFAAYYSAEGRRIWLEDDRGVVRIGDPWPGMAPGEREPLISRRLDPGPGAALLFLKIPEPSILARFAVERGGEAAFVCFNWRQAPLVYHWSVFVQGLLGLVCLSLALSLWTAKRISRPLADLRLKVMRMASGELDLRLPEGGEEEMADVSKAVNHLADSLSRHMSGMRSLMANMSHEMRSSVSSLSMCLEILQEALEPLLEPAPDDLRPVVADNLGQALMETELLEGMVASGLLGGKLDFGQESFETAPLDFSSLLRQVADRHAHRARLKGVILRPSIAPDVWLSGDEALLDRLLANIVDNALKYTPKGGEIRLSLEASEQIATVVCQNTHAPLAEELLRSLGRPYFRAGGGHVYGAGLGLYLVGKIVALHQGELRLSNCDLGLEALVELPIGKPQDAS